MTADTCVKMPTPITQDGCFPGGPGRPLALAVHFSWVRVIIQVHALVRLVFGGRTPMYSYLPGLRVMSPDVGGVL
jgi:hypothetical protein